MVNAAAEHYTKFLLLKGHLKEDNTIKKSDFRKIFLNEYQPENLVNTNPNDLLIALVSNKFIKKKKSKENEDISFNTPKVLNILDKLKQTHFKELGLPDEKLTRPVKKVIVAQQHAFQTKIQKDDGIDERSCRLCGVVFSSTQDYESHIDMQSHQLRYIYRTDRKLLDPTEYQMQILVNKKRNTSDIIVRLDTPQKISVGLVKKKGPVYELLDVFSLTDVMEVTVQKPKFPTSLQLGKPFSFSLTCLFKEPGAYVYFLMFKLMTPEHEYVVVLKEIVFYVQSELMDDLAPVSPFKRNTPVLYVEEPAIVFGEPPPAIKSSLRITPPKEYKIPVPLNVLINEGLKITKRSSDAVKKKAKEVVNILKITPTGEYCKAPNENIYSQFFQLLLHMEEHQMQKDIHNYDRANQTMEIVKENKKLLKLKVPGLAEKRPSLMRGDSVYVVIQGEKKEVRYEGNVHFIKECDVWLGFHSSFMEIFQPGLKFKVFFSFSRHSLRCQHRALEQITSHRIQSLMFPNQPQKSLSSPSVVGPWFNKDLNTNPEQQQAVRNIVASSSFPAPYLVFGPPGTGKTVTIVEAIMQLCHLKGDASRILVCTPSNSAADVVTVRLLKCIPKSHILRMYAASFSSKLIQETITPCSNYDSVANEYFYPSREEIMKYRIVIVTLITAGKLVSGSIPAGHFSHIFIDESGHAAEPEAIIPIAGLMSSKQTKGQIRGQLVLAGDPKQLGPLLRSLVATQLGLGTSLLERLMTTCELYARDKNSGKYNPAVLTKLVKNFRSHSKILEIPNQMFYDGELKSSDNPEINIACNWSKLPQKNFPLIFHAVMGKDERESSSPSYFNRQEIDVVIKYVRDLLQDKFCGRRLRQEDIGIVTPYRRQVEKFQKCLQKTRMEGIRVGSVEEFQGQERLVIIISTVRSSFELIEEDYKFRLGFLKNYKRFNVALTRARALLIVVGNPKILQFDVHWKQFIEFCQSHGGYTGTPFIPTQNIVTEMELFTMKFSDLNITENPHVEDGPKWRGEN